MTFSSSDFRYGNTLWFLPLLASLLAGVPACQSMPGAGVKTDTPHQGSPSGSPSNPATAMTALPDFDARWNYEDPAASEAAFRELLPQAQTSGNPGYQAELLSQLARAQGLQQHYEEALQTLQQAEALTTDSMAVARVRITLERGRVLNSSGKKPEASPLFLSAFDLAQKAGLENLTIDAAHMMGIVTSGDESLQWNLRAMALAEAAKDPKARGWLGPLYNNTAWTYFDMGKYPEALALFERDVKLREANQKPVEAGIARWSVARTLRALGRVDEALQMQQALLQHPDRKDNDSEGYTQEEIGECQLLLGRNAEAQRAFARAYSLLKDDPWLKQDEPARLERLRTLGGVP